MQAALLNSFGESGQAATANKLRRVLHVINGEHYSGAERVQDLLASRLSEFGYEVGFACLKPGAFGQNRKYLKAPVFDVPMRGRVDWTISRRLEYEARKFECSILHAHTPRSLMVAAPVAKRLELPLVYHVHSPVGRDSTRRFRNWLNAWSERRNLAQAQKLICVSSSLRGYMLEQGHPASKLSVVLNGVPMQDRCVQPPSIGQPWTIGMVALFRPRKGVEVLLEAIRILVARGTSIRLECVGAFENAAYQSEILALAKKLEVEPSVTWTGFERNVDYRLRNMQLLALPSLFGEGLPMVVLEAMAVGLPVIASRVEGVPEAIRDGVDGLMAEPGDPQDFADQIQKATESPHLWRDLSESCWSRQRSLLSDYNMALEVSQIYDQLGR